ncbi:MAG: YdcF family protein [Gammaproteobacteria bacterium]
MTVLILLLLVALTTFFAALRCKKISFAIFTFTLLSFVAISYGFLPTLLLNQLELPFSIPGKITWGKQNAIILLGAGIARVPETNNVKPSLIGYSRIYTAAQYYLACKQSGNTCTVIISGGDASHIGVTEAHVYKKSLMDLNLKSTDLLLETKSMNTFENAKFTAELIKLKKFSTISLVTSNIHMKRALLYFSYFGIIPIPISSDYMAPMISVIPVAYNFVLSDFALHEYLGILRFRIYNYFGWNEKSSGVGAI